MRPCIPPHCSRILLGLLVSAAICAAFPGAALAQAVSEKAKAPATAPKASPNGAPNASGTGPKGPAGKAPAGKKDAPAAGADATDPATAEGATPASTEENQAASKQALEQGREAYKAGDYVMAAAHFTSSMKLASNVEAQFWLAMALDLQGKATEAVDAFETLFADPRHTDLPAEQLEPAKQRFEVLQQIPATVVIHVSPPNPQLQLNGEVQEGSSPFSLEVPAGTHKLQVSTEGFETVETELTVKPAQTIEQALELKEQPEQAPATQAEPAAAPPPAEPPSKLPAYVTLGVAGAGAVVGTIFGIQALSAKSDFDKEKTVDAADDVERNALIADMAFGLAITLGITGVVLLTSDEAPDGEAASARPVKPSRKARLEVAPYVSPYGGGAAARGTF